VLLPELDCVFRRVQDSAHYMPNWQMEVCAALKSTRELTPFGTPDHDGAPRSQISTLYLLPPTARQSHRGRTVQHELHKTNMDIVTYEDCGEGD
jgi:hypothetical protein